MTYLILGLAIFFGAHLFSAFRSREPGKDLAETMGYGPFKGVFSLVSIIGFVLICYGYGAARPSAILYTPPGWTVHLQLLLMIPVMILLVSSNGPVGHIKKAVKHPMLVAVKLWALGHLLVNGELNSLILFGSFLAYGVIDRIMVKRRGDTGPGPEVNITVVADVVAVVAGLGLYLLFYFYLHAWLIGVPIIAAS